MPNPGGAMELTPNTEMFDTVTCEQEHSYARNETLTTRLPILTIPSTVPSSISKTLRQNKFNMNNRRSADGDNGKNIDGKGNNNGKSNVNPPIKIRNSE